MLARSESNVCPCCGRELVVPTIAHWFGKAPVLMTLFELLTEHPYGLTHGQLLDKIYRGNHEPNDLSALRARICQFNKSARQRGLGLRIRSRGGNMRRYRIYVVRGNR